MKNRGRNISDRAAPKQQRNWDMRAASNFIAGGAGGGLLLWASLAGVEADVGRTAILLGLMLIGAGLTCVWFEIGRPWRALNVYRHFATSWMTREAVVALLVFAAGGLSRRILWFPLAQQALQILPLLLATQLIMVISRMVAGADFPGMGYFLGSFTAALLWYPLTFLLLLPQYQPIEKDENRPI